MLVACKQLWICHHPWIINSNFFNIFPDLPVKYLFKRTATITKMIARRKLQSKRPKGKEFKWVKPFRNAKKNLISWRSRQLKIISDIPASLLPAQPQQFWSQYPLETNSARFWLQLSCNCNISSRSNEENYWKSKMLIMIFIIIIYFSINIYNISNKIKLK